MEYPTKEQQIGRIASRFLPASSFRSFTRIPTGHINQTYRVSVYAEGGVRNYLMQNLNTRVFANPEKVTQNIVRCADFLSKNCPDYPYDILTPIPVAQNEEYLFYDEGLAWRMFDYIEDSRSIDQVTTTQEAAMIGEAFGVFLSFINRDDASRYQITIPDFHNFTRRYQNFRGYLAGRPAVTEEKARYLIAEIDRYASPFLELEKMNFPLRIVHHDTKANNVMLDVATGKPKCIIDLDTLMPGNIFSDFGDLIRTVLNPYEEDEFPENGNLVSNEIIKSLFDSFLEPLNQLLTNIEKEYLIRGGKKITLLQVLRFLDDHLKGDPYYQVDYAGHNLDRALSQMNLFLSMEANELFNTP